MQKRASNNYFSFTRKEKNGTIFLLIVILLLSVIPLLYPFFFREKSIDTSEIKNELLVLKAREKESHPKYAQNHFEENNNDEPFNKKVYTSSIKGELFNFDPNTISPGDWKKLGLRDKTISTIQNFISKGGKFRLPEDIKKIWGLHEDEIERLIPYVKIAEISPVSERNKDFSAAMKFESKKSLAPIDINQADSSVLIRLPGIGPKLSNRIISFRDKLGGFYKIEQVAETFGLADSVYQKIKASLVIYKKNIRQININTVSLDQLKQHPYIRYNIANAIVQYRLQHGNFVSVEDIKKIMIVTDDIYNKLSPYLTVN